MSSQTLRRLAWYGFDAGNSAHALLVSTVGFALYFKIILLQGKPEADNLWAILTTLILGIAAVSSPLLVTWGGVRGKRWLGLWAATLVSVAATCALSMDVSLVWAVLFYLLSAVGYYLALPIYTSYLGEWAAADADKVSARGWAVGYLGGLVSVSLAFVMGLLDHPIADRPDLYRLIFALAGVFNLVLSVPMLLAAYQDRGLPPPTPAEWRISAAFNVFRQQPEAMRLLVAYWMVAEAGTITLYFTAIFLAEYAKMPIPKIFMLTLVVQAIAMVCTWAVGQLAAPVGRRKLFFVVSAIWALVPILLWTISKGFSYWIPLTAIGLVLGAHHAIVRAEVASIASDAELTVAGRWSLYGFLEVAGRLSSILGPLIVALLTVFIPLSEALLCAALFPVIGLLIVKKYIWK